MTQPAPARSLNPEISDLLQQLGAIQLHADLLTAQLTSAQFNWAPAPGIWSIAECINHLNIVDGGDLAALQSTITDARSRAITNPGPFKYSWWSRYFIASMEPPVKRKFKAPKYYQPPPDADPIATMSQFRRIQTTLTTLVRQADGLDLARVKVPFVNVKVVQMQLGARFQLLTAHDRRHLAQAEAIRRHPNFPPA